MARIAGVDLPARSAFRWVSPTFMVSARPLLTRSWKQLASTPIPESRTDSEEEAKIRDYIDQLTSSLKATCAATLLWTSSPVEIQSFRGTRHRKNLPCRGQRTKTNARTCKGPKRTVANKKK